MRVLSKVEIKIGSGDAVWGIFLAAFLLLNTGAPVWAQETMQNGTTPLEPPAQGVPPLPGGDGLEPRQVPPELDEQTPTEQEDVIPLTEDDQPEGDNEAGMLDKQQQPQFDRDAVPRSTEQERESGQVQEEVVPGYEDEATGGAQPGMTSPDIVPVPDGGMEPQPGTPEEDPALPPVNPDEIPDRRFETFETEWEGGTPPMPVPEQQPELNGATPERAPL